MRKCEAMSDRLMPLQVQPSPARDRPKSGTFEFRAGETAASRIQSKWLHKQKRLVPKATTLVTFVAPSSASLHCRALESAFPTLIGRAKGSYRTLVLSTSQSLNTTFQTEVPEILPYYGPINSAEVQTQLYSKRFTPKIHSSPHNRQNQTLIAMHQLTLPLNPAEPQSSPH